MNKNPLLVKSSLLEKIPFLKGRTAELYGRYLSNHRFSKIIGDSGLSETVSAFTMNSKYKLNDSQIHGGIDPKDFIFDQADITPSKFFSEKEWIALGMVLRAYKEVENINLMHLYNCLYSGENNRIRGFVVTGRMYTLYSSTQLPVKVTVTDQVTGLSREGRIRSLSRNNPTLITPSIEGTNSDRLVEISLEFTGNNYQPSTLVEGVYSGLSLKTLDNSANGFTASTDKYLVPENLKIGEYSSKLVEFFAGTLVTPLSDSKLISNIGNKLPRSGATVWDKVKENTTGLYNQDGYLDRRSKV